MPVARQSAAAFLLNLFAKRYVHAAAVYNAAAEFDAVALTQSRALTPADTDFGYGLILRRIYAAGNLNL